jgi:hypothetical protein
MPFEIKSIYGLKDSEDSSIHKNEEQMVGLPPSADEDES